MERIVAHHYSWNTIIAFLSNDETFVRRTRRRQYNPEAENRNSLVNILGRTIVNEDGNVTTNITKQQLPLLEGSIQSVAAEGILRVLLF